MPQSDNQIFMFIFELYYNVGKSKNFRNALRFKTLLTDLKN